ncbi:hypothetical protein L2E82_11557 [Cichorium intybus]|uniref:Uncharacterized protein n=1 Tax=Cichorium intybus TaxID=13427 RepID=A0ACB9GEP4_CICIN|nr:hypothetical protein L2E82_11557 [Cichorium intybus]
MRDTSQVAIGRQKTKKMDPVESTAELHSAARLRSHFMHVLRSRRSPEVPLEVLPAKPVLEPLYQGPAVVFEQGTAAVLATLEPLFLYQRTAALKSSEVEIPKPDIPNLIELLDVQNLYLTAEAIKSSPKAEILNLEEILIEEKFYLTTEEGDQGRLPVVILSMKEHKHSKRPAVVFLHPSNTNKEFVRPLQESYASRGYITIAIDARYHGERAKDSNTYQDALVSSWKRGDTMPFIYDTVWDLVKLADYLTRRHDIDHSRIGIAGLSLGGMHAWFASFVDTRYSVVVPVIGVQDFRWAIDNDKWQARVESIKPVFEEARIDLGKDAIDKEVVEKVWDRIAPGLTSKFDSIHTVPLIAPRPLLILNGEIDPRCPIEGLNHTISRTRKAFEYAQRSDDFNVIIEDGIGHYLTDAMVKEGSDWFDKFLKP